MESKDTRLDESIKRIKFACDMAGLNLVRKSPYKHRLLFIFNILWSDIDVGSAFAYIVGGIVSGKAFMELTYGGPCVIFSILANFKAMSIVLNEEKLHGLFASLRKLEKSNENDNFPGKEEIVNEDVDFLHGLLKKLNVCYILLVVGFSVNPVSVTLYKYLKNEVDLRLPFFVLYPFDAFDMRYWPYVYVQQVWAAVIVILWLCTGDYIFYVCCTYLRVQFRLLEHKFEHMVTRETRKEDFQAEFRKLVMWHQELIQCTQTLEAIYSKSTLCNFVSSSLMICLTLFDVLMISDILLVMSFGFFLVTSLCQIFFYCYFGDLLMSSSAAVGSGAYRSLWYLKEAYYGKALLLIQLRCHKACKLTAYGFADVHLPAFARILSNAWSYFALLNTTLRN